MNNPTTTTEQSELPFDLSIRHLLYVMVSLMILLSAVLLFVTVRINQGYEAISESTHNLIDWQTSAEKLQDGSDILTNYARLYVQTGNKEYMDAYFEEALSIRTRDQGLEELKEIHGDSQAYQSLEQAMAESVRLMDREYYAMRLTSDAYGYEVSELPQEIQNVILSEEDRNSSSFEKEFLARRIIYDSTYQQNKATISSHIESCLIDLKDEVESAQSTIQVELQYLLIWQAVVIVLLILISIGMLITTLILVINPLLKAEQYIRQEELIPIKGSSEFRFLASTYNRMFESHQEQNRHLAFEASHDKLTGCYNRAGYDLIVRNLDLPSSALLVIDVDKFKGINDTYGHVVGDQVLIRVAQVLRSAFRSQDYVCRPGGDEFIVIMRDISSPSASLIEYKLRTINDQLQAPADGLPSASVSCGAAFGIYHETYADLFASADEAVYEVKNKGGCGCKISLPRQEDL
ncbi:MAG: GGDEF domain-containing protein [Solobacterium sp.]|nr:GGDEF domain-containing protein [Solobacterium sp.]